MTPVDEHPDGEVRYLDMQANEFVYGRPELPAGCQTFMFHDRARRRVLIAFRKRTFTPQEAVAQAKALGFELKYP